MLIIIGDMNTLVANFENLPGTAMEFHFQKSLYLMF